MRLLTLWILAAISVGCGPTPLDDDSSNASQDAAIDRVDAGAIVSADAGVCTEVVDLVFVLDTSSSMGFVLSQLEEQIRLVVDASNAVAADAHFGLVVFQDNVFLDDSGPLGGGFVHTEAASLQRAFAYYRTTFTNADRNPGDGPNGPRTQNPICEENSLDALYAAAADFPWRDNATRVVIVATDDTFLEAPDNYGDRDGDGQTNQTNYPREGDYPALRTYDDTVAELRNRRIRVFSFSRVTQPGLFDRCGTGRRYPWASITDGWTTPYKGRDPIPQRTDARNFDIDYVRDGIISLSETINDVVVDSYCLPPIL